MAATLWIDDDAGYERWLATHTDGFMANLNRPLGGRYFRIHRATHDLPDSSHPDSVNPWTGRQYQKVTAASIADLLAWANANLPTADPQYCKICLPNHVPSPESAPTTDSARYVLEADRLRARGPVPRPAGVAKPEAVQGTTTLFYRDPKVRAWILQRAEGRCELCGCAPFITEHAAPYLESHHLVRLAEGGPDTPENTAALCPNCHRELHYGADRITRTQRLTQALAAKDLAKGRP